MKIFISWSGEFSQKVASALKEWLPCVIQSIEVFFSTEDIEKGEKWDSKISGELSESEFGIVCLTSQNVSAPWIHFEAGALSKALDDKVSALMLNVNPSDIKGPLSRFQATKFTKEDFYKLLETINNNNDTKLEESILKRTFEVMWEKINVTINNLIKEYDSESIKNPKKTTEINENREAIEEILQILRNQNNILSNPEKLLPMEYFEYLMRNSNEHTKMRGNSKGKIYNDLYEYLSYVLNKNTELNEIEYLNKIQFIQLIHIIVDNIYIETDARIRKRWLTKFLNLKERYLESNECKKIVEAD
ncbi:Hypothetical protein CM240_2952 [Clostridium bornimense]|uniref:TIR domain-containing protein n=1 Tax=Clostridium bornimense TaxID=1216932 RepID=W6S2E4_9CLOT|nr:toll/interleukin-1 receptor domain-containing protein [Clostridium bornimense]CDM70069.1 Hypothetical protein CM240_2952 [Clostridium bornimense]